MNIEIGSIIAFSYSTEPRQGVRDVKASRQRTQSGQTSWNEKKPAVDVHDPYPQALILHNNWKGAIHAINLNQLSQAEINFLTAIVDPFFAEERVKIDGRLRSELMRVPKDIHITDPHSFYLRVIKPFIHLYDSYRIYLPNKMLNIKVVKSYKDIEQRLKTTQKTSQTGQTTKPGSVIKSPEQHSDFFQRYIDTIGRLRGPRFK